jgi:hypothetical protein
VIFSFKGDWQLAPLGWLDPCSSSGMKLHHLTDETLLTAAQKLVSQERELLTLLLHHLREIERRRLFSTLGFPSLFAYAVKQLGYPEDQAHRRVSAMRLMRELPELEEKISSGELNLTQIGLAKAAFKRGHGETKEDFTREEKLEVLSRLENTTTRQAEKVLQEFSPDEPRPDKIRPLPAELIELRFAASETLREKIEAVKGLLAHRFPDLTLGALFEKLCDLGIEEWQPKSRMAKKIWEKAGGKCELCGSRYALEVDHLQPRAYGGSSEETNLRLLCRSCNQRAAIEKLGMEKMEEYLT